MDRYDRFTNKTESTNGEHTDAVEAQTEAIVADASAQDRITNGVVIKSGDETHRFAFSIDTITSEIYSRTGGWPRRVGELLFVRNDRKDGVYWLNSQPDLFAWLGHETGKPSKFHRGPDFHTKEECVSGVRRTARQYESVERLPHEPPIPDVYYCCPKPTAGDGRLLQELIGRFNPSTETDRQLLKAAFTTPGWGGRGGTRPAFMVTAFGRGQGKTTLLSAVGLLWGGVIELSANENSEAMKHRLLSDGGLERRIVALDNIKGRRMSWPDFESLITASVISGKRLYHGEHSRPNHMTYMLTMNGASLSTDIAQRCVIIQLSKPNYDGNWRDDLFRFIEDNRDGLIADVVGFLKSPARELKAASRWGDWEAAVLARLDNPEAAQKLILDRQGEANVETEEADIIQDYFRMRLSELGYNPDTNKVHIPNTVAVQWFKSATNEQASTTFVTRTVNQLHSEGSLVNLSVCPTRSYGRGLQWVGSESDSSTVMLTDLQHQMEKLERLSREFGRGQF